MDKIYVVFWTQGGNTQAMAEAIGEGIREAGKEAEAALQWRVAEELRKKRSAK